MEQVPAGLVGSEIHGFRTMEDLDMRNMMEEAKSRWLRPNEIHAVLCNHKYFNISVKPVNLPSSGTIVLFDRKMLRNFRKDGHNWKKKKDGKTVKEAHEHLKVGNNERIHVYYAHGEDRTTFVRRCYWLLDKKLEHIVLVHYRDTQELQGSPRLAVDSNSSSDPPTSSNLSEEIDGVDQVYFTESNETVVNHEMKIHEINTLEWDELGIPNDSNKLIISGENVAHFDQPDQYGLNGPVDNSNSSLGNKLAMENLLATFHHETVREGNSIDHSIDLQQIGINGTQVASVGLGVLDVMRKDGLPPAAQESFGRWMNCISVDSPGSIDDPFFAPESLLTGQPSLGTINGDHYDTQVFNITEVSPSWALSTEETKILVVGVFHEKHMHLANSNLFCVCGDVCVPAEIIQSGVFRCIITPQSPGTVNLFLSFDGHKPISQLMMFDFRGPPATTSLPVLDEKPDWQELQIKMRLAHLLFSTSKTLNILSGKIPHKNQKEAVIFAQKTRHIVDSWDYLVTLVKEKGTSFQLAKNSLFELTLQNRLLEWLLERVLEGCKLVARDDEGQGVIHLCAILDYNWAIYPYSWSGLSLDFRDKFGWTALHWAAHYGRQRMVASLLSAGANPNLVTDPTSENPSGCTAADLAAKSGFEGLAAYLAEKALVSHFEAMTLAGNISGSLQSAIPTNDDCVPNPLTQVEEDQFLKDSLAAYRTAADAAARIHAAFREHSFKLRRKEVEYSNTENEARYIIAAMRIQHAFRNHETKKQMSAALRIQYRFRTWKIRKDFLNKRRHAIKIQATFRGHQVRRQYTKILWSVGVVEKAILRWRLKRKGFRGLQVDNKDDEKDEKQEDNGEEGFFHASRKQAEERVERSVVRVQAMFRSKKAQEEYRKMKQEHTQASLEYNESLDPATDMEK